MAYELRIFVAYPEYLNGLSLGDAPDNTINEFFQQYSISNSDTFADLRNRIITNNLHSLTNESKDFTQSIQWYRIVLQYVSWPKIGISQNANFNNAPIELPKREKLFSIQLRRNNIYSEKVTSSNKTIDDLELSRFPGRTYFPLDNENVINTIQSDEINFFGKGVYFVCFMDIRQFWGLQTSSSFPPPALSDWETAGCTEWLGPVGPSEVASLLPATIDLQYLGSTGPFGQLLGDLSGGLSYKLPSSPSPGPQSPAGPAPQASPWTAFLAQCPADSFFWQLSSDALEQGMLHRRVQIGRSQQEAWRPLYFLLERPRPRGLPRLWFFGSSLSPPSFVSLSGAAELQEGSAVLLLRALGEGPGLQLRASSGPEALRWLRALRGVLQGSLSPVDDNAVLRGCEKELQEGQRARSEEDLAPLLLLARDPLKGLLSEPGLREGFRAYVSESGQGLCLQLWEQTSDFLQLLRAPSLGVGGALAWAGRIAEAFLEAFRAQLQPLHDFLTHLHSLGTDLGTDRDCPELAAVSRELLRVRASCAARLRTLGHQFLQTPRARRLALAAPHGVQRARRSLPVLYSCRGVAALVDPGPGPSSSYSSGVRQAFLTRLGLRTTTGARRRPTEPGGEGSGAYEGALLAAAALGAPQRETFPRPGVAPWRHSPLLLAPSPPAAAEAGPSGLLLRASRSWGQFVLGAAPLPAPSPADPFPSPEPAVDLSQGLPAWWWAGLPWALDPEEGPGEEALPAWLPRNPSRPSPSPPCPSETQEDPFLTPLQQLHRLQEGAGLLGSGLFVSAQPLPSAPAPPAFLKGLQKIKALQLQESGWGRQPGDLLGLLRPAGLGNVVFAGLLRCQPHRQARGQARPRDRGHGREAGELLGQLLRARCTPPANKDPSPPTSPSPPAPKPARTAPSPSPGSDWTRQVGLLAVSVQGSLRLHLLSPALGSADWAAIDLLQLVRAAPSSQQLHGIDLLDRTGLCWRLLPEGLDEDDARMISARWLQMLATYCLPATDVVLLLKSGYLLKRGGYNTAFRSRWFVLSSDFKLRYYTDDTASAVYKGEIDLRAVDRLRDSGGSSSKGSVVCFDRDIVLSMRDSRQGRVWRLQATDAAEAQLWVELLVQLVAAGTGMAEKEPPDERSAVDDEEDTLFEDDEEEDEEEEEREEGEEAGEAAAEGQADFIVGDAIDRYSCF